VTPKEIFETAARRTRGRVAGRHILVPQDTTSLRDDGDKQSLQQHPAIAIDAADGALLGLVHAEFLRRDGAPRAHCDQRPLAQKDSQRWITATAEAAALVDAGAAGATVISDREGDIYEEFACRPPSVDVFARARVDGALADGRRIYDSTRGLSKLGRQIIDLPAAPGRPARQASIALRACRIEIRRPKRNSAKEAAKLPASVALSLVEAYETDPPAGAARIHCRLLTTHAVDGFAEGTRITGFCRQRWTIEQLFRLMKTKGIDIEAVRMEDVRPFENLAAATLVAAIKVQQMLRDRDGQAGGPPAMSSTPPISPPSKPSARALKAKPTSKRTRMSQARRPSPHGSAPASQAGPATTRTGRPVAGPSKTQNHDRGMETAARCVNLVGLGWVRPRNRRQPIRKICRFHRIAPSIRAV
jgi:hypothetical protein